MSSGFFKGKPQHKIVEQKRNNDQIKKNEPAHAKTLQSPINTEIIAQLKAPRIFNSSADRL